MRDEPKDVPVGGYLSSKKRAQEERALFLLALLTPAFFIETSACTIPTLHASLYSKGVLCRNPGSWSNFQNGGNLSWMNCFASDLKIIPKPPLYRKSQTHI